MNRTELKKLMSGIAVVIDDALEKDGTANNNDRIGNIVKEMKKWEFPIYIENRIPSSDVICNSLLQSASFVLLDWKLWEGGGSELEGRGIEENIKFLKKAKSYFIPIFIFTNENPEDIKDKICPHNLYDSERASKNFIFIRRKGDLTGNKLHAAIKNWISENSSVYTLKAWEQALYKAKRELFSSMYEKNPDWPKVFWKSYRDDGIDPSSSIVNLINDSLFGRIKTENLRSDVFDGDLNVCKEDLQSVLEGISFIQNKSIDENEIRAGDLFKIDKEKYLINIRPDCDCIPRSGTNADSIELYCLSCKELAEEQIRKNYNRRLENFKENHSQAFIFPVDRGKVVEIKFSKLQVIEFSKLRGKRAGRLLHPYITKIQQRYALYLQRQGLPRIPKAAIL